MAHLLSDEAYKAQKKAIWQATGIMAVVTILEVAVAIYMKDTLPQAVISLLFIFMSILKAFYIMGEFMHLKYEKRSLVLAILVPFLFLIWGVIAFIWEGGSWAAMRAAF